MAGNLKITVQYICN